MTRKSRAVTLPEILIALAVAAVALLTLVLFIGVIHRASREGKSQATASTIARSHLERLRADTEFFNEVKANNPWEADKTEVLSANQSSRMSATSFHIRVGLTPMASNDRYQEAEVLVTWTEQGRERKVRLVSYLPTDTL
jgi:Tfp pilus assembly protein PilV